ncbi:MAG: ATP-dependent DNA helicase [Candidatus Zambryskibacteria bacterium]
MLFEERYKKLNAEQKLAVDTIEGPVLVVAGPGTGKTEILTLRIGNILKKTDTSPENILALTFTDNAAVNMRRRLSTLIGSSAYRVVIETFHSFCNNIIADYPEYFPNIVGSTNISEVESISLLGNLINDLPLDLLRPWGEPLHYIRDILKKIEELKREGLSPEEFVQILEKEEKIFKSREDLHHEKGAYRGKMKGEHKDFEKQLVKNKELFVVYDAYQKALHKKRLYDWSDMIMEVLGAIKSNADLKLILQEEHQYILVDEHQDTNNAQNKILELLCDFHKNPNIFIVGDEKQAIFRFQGASMENFMYVKKLYPKVKLIELSKNYRSGQNILDIAHSLIPSKNALTSHLKNSAQIYTAEFKNKNHELFFVADHIQNLIKKDGVAPEEIAILYRSNNEAFAVADALEKKGLPFVIESKEDLLSEKFVGRLLLILNALFYYSQDEYLIPVMHIDQFDIAPLDAYRIINKASKEKKSLYDLISKSEIPAILELDKKLKKWIKDSKNDHLSQFLERILRESAILQAMISSKNADAFLGIGRLFEEAKRISVSKPGANFSDFMKYMEIVREHKLFIERPKHAVKSKIHLMTAHKAKGLEFEYVYIVNSTEKSFGPKASRDHLKLVPLVYSLNKDAKPEDRNNIDDERRLFYVALTRAKKTVLITYASQDENGKEVLVSPFVLELREDKREKIDTEKYEEKMSEKPEDMMAERISNKATEIDKKFVAELFKSETLSVTALNNYLDCPWKYFYRNLLRIPSVPEKHQIYGTAMHAAVEDLWKAIKEKGASEKFLLDSYKRHLGLLGILSREEFKEALSRGSKALSGWFRWSRPEILNPIITEFAIRGVEVSPGIVLSGKIDKVEVVGKSRFIVTDYKTGKQKSRNDIEGLTKSSTGDIKRQLQFYKLLLELHSDIKMERGIIEFLEPEDNGKYKREEFDISDGEVAELKKTIKRVADEITSLSFWNTTCDDKNCEYCGFRRLLK